jgi:hypothetical protein
MFGYNFDKDDIGWSESGSNVTIEEEEEVDERY